MILTDDEKNEQGEVTKEGQRTKAGEFFAGLPQLTQTAFLNATVMLKVEASHKGSGVIFFDDATNNKAYVITAKHLLLTLNGKTEPEEGKKPADYAEALAGKVTLHYQPTQLLGNPQKTAPVTGFNFTGSSDQTWTYDIMILEVTDGTFRGFVQQQAFISSTNKYEYYTELDKQGTGSPVLNKRNYKYIQMGYGKGRDPDVVATMNAKTYTDYWGKIQCKQSTPAASAPLQSEMFEVDQNTDSSTWPTIIDGCVLDADDTNSTGPGDSGGPLFAIEKGSTTPKIYLAGTTTGANYFTNQAYKENPSTAPGDDHLHNNIVTFWYTLFDAWVEEIP